MLKKTNFVQTIFIFILIVRAIETRGLMEIDSYNKLNDEEPKFFKDSKYLIGYLFFWNFLFEISLIIVLNFKQHQKYVREHVFINFIVVVGQLVNNCAFFSTHSSKNVFFLGEVAILTFTIIQTMLGFSLNQKLISIKLVKGIFILRCIHKHFGRIIYALTKFQIAIFMYYYYANTGVSAFLAIGLLFGLTFSNHIFLWVVLNLNNKNLLQVSNYLVDTKKNVEGYLELLKSIEMGEVESEDDEFMINSGLSESSNDFTQEIIQQKINWVMIENKVFDITDLRHPKGNYILHAVNKKDITRQIYGLKSWRFENREINYHKNTKHQHVARTFEFLKEHCIGEISVSPLITSMQDRVPSSKSIPSIGTINLFARDKESLEQSKQKINFWTARQKQYLDENSDLKILFVSKLENDCAANLSNYWPSWFGKYFFVRHSINEFGYYFVTMSLSTKYRVEKKKWYDDLKSLPSVDFLFQFENDDILQLHDVIYKDSESQIKKFANSSSETIDLYLPLLEIGNQENYGLKIDSKFSLYGPIGLGLGFTTSTTKKILISISDEGSIPFLDFFEFLSQRAILEVTNLKFPHPIFSKEYLLAYANNVEFFVYWEVSNQFLANAPILGLSALKTIGIIQKSIKGSESIFPDSKICQMVKRVTIVSKKQSSELGNVAFINSKGHDFLSIKDLASDKSFGRIDMAVISGKEDFVERVLKNVDLKPSQIAIL